MGMRPTHDPYGGLNPLVDKLIGVPAYEVVRRVACNLDYIRAVGCNIERVFQVSENLDDVKKLLAISEDITQLALHADEIAFIAEHYPEIQEIYEKIPELLEVNVEIEKAYQASNRSIDAADRAEQARDVAIAAAEATGNIVFVDTYADAVALLPLPDETVFEVSQDETKDNSRTRYIVESGALVFAVDLDQTRRDLANATDPMKGAGLVANAVARVDSIAALRALPPPGRRTAVYVEGYHTSNDGGGSQLMWVPSSTKPDNGVTVFMPGSNPANGRWERNPVGNLPLEWCGWVPGTDASDALGRAMAWLNQPGTVSNGGKVQLPRGTVTHGLPIEIPVNGARIVGHGIYASTLVYSGLTGAAIRGAGGLRTYCGVEDVFVRVLNPGCQAIDWTWFSYSTFRGIGVDLRASYQEAFFAKGNGLGTGPYYNLFDDYSVIGSNNPSTAPGQVAFRLAPATDGNWLADGPNANVFSNARRISGVEKAFDIQSGNGNLGVNISLESIHDYAFVFNDRPADFTGTASSGNISSFTDSSAPFDPPVLIGGGAFKIVGGAGAGASGTIRVATGTTISAEINNRTGVPFDATSQYEVYKTKAQFNKFSGVRLEGNAATGKLARFCAGALGNTITLAYATSISEVQWTKDVEEGSNWCLSGSAGESAVLPFWVDGGLTAGATHGMQPNPTTTLGSGYRLPVKSGFIVGLSVSCASLSGVVGSATIKVYRGNVHVPELNVVLNGDTLYGGASFAKQYATTSNLRFETQHDIDVRIECSPDWNGTSRAITAALMVQY